MAWLGILMWRICLYAAVLGERGLKQTRSLSWPDRWGFERLDDVYIYLVVCDGMNTDPFIFSVGVCLNRFTSSSSSKLTLLLNVWETWITRSWSALFTFTMDWHRRSDADRSIVVWLRLSLSVCARTYVRFGIRPYQFYRCTDPSLNWQPPLQSSHTWPSYAISGPVPRVADLRKKYSLKLERDLARFREKLDVQRTGGFFFLVETFECCKCAGLFLLFSSKKNCSS